ncbi:MAG: hypothetical protein ABSE73_19615, partial [Planctomycetota bacterium]
PHTKLYLGDYSAAREQRELALAPARAAEESAKARERQKPPQPEAAAPKPRKINEFKLQAIETRIAALEEERARLSGRLYDEDIFRDGRKVKEVSAELAEIEKQLLQLGKEWEAVIEAANG